MEILTVEEAEIIYGELIEHLGTTKIGQTDQDRFSPEEATKRATDILAKIYLSVEQ